MSTTDGFDVQDERGGRFGILYFEHVVCPEMRSVSKAGLRIYMALICYCNRKTGRTDPKQKTLAEVLGYDLRTVERGIKSLKGAKLIDVRRHPKNPYRVSYVLIDPPSMRPE